jgi:hypothetical protein
VLTMIIVLTATFALGLILCGQSQLRRALVGSAGKGKVPPLPLAVEGER